MVGKLLDLHFRMLDQDAPCGEEWDVRGNLEPESTVLGAVERRVSRSPTQAPGRIVGTLAETHKAEEADLGGKEAGDGSISLRLQEGTQVEMSVCVISVGTL